MTTFEANTTDKQNRKVILSCQNVWKIFGPNAKNIKSAPTSEEIIGGNLIAAVRDASLEIFEGEIFVIMGLSGSGKSTLVRCLSRLIEASLGSVMFDGKNLLNVSDNELKEIRRHRMGMVFQNFALLPHLTVHGNVVFPLEIQGLEKNICNKRALEMIRLYSASLKARIFC